MTALEHCVRSFARRITQNGVVSIVTNGHPALVSAFKELGWPDPYPDPKLLPEKHPLDTRSVKATLEPTEKAVLPDPKGRTGVFY